MDAAAEDKIGASPPREGALYRAVLGLVALVGGLLGLAASISSPSPKETGSRCCSRSGSCSAGEAPS